MNGTQESRKSESALSANQPILTSREKLTQERVLELFNYSESGCLLWKHTNRNVVAKEIAGTIRGKGYRQVMVDGKNYYSHRLVWLYHNGYLPENNVDHINREPSDNRIENLREATQKCNIRNTGNPVTNTSGVKGVMWRFDREEWEVGITNDQKRIYLGRHKCFIEAVCHRLAAEQCLNWSGCDSCSPAFQFIQKLFTKTGRNQLNETIL